MLQVPFARKSQEPLNQFSSETMQRWQLDGTGLDQSDQLPVRNSPKTRGFFLSATDSVLHNQVG